MILGIWVGMGVVRGEEKERPNFVVINIDDLGYADIGPFGSVLNRTPNLDRMAKEGCRLTSFYGAPVCSPSRASLMTGCYAKRVLPIPHVFFPGGANGLALEEETIAEALKGAGYVTGMVGKWHLGDQREFLPTRQGFDRWYGLPYSNDMGLAEDGAKSNYGKPVGKGDDGQPPLPLMRNEKVIGRVLAKDQEKLVERYTAEAVSFIKENKERRFFLYLAHNAVHWPLYPGEKFRGKSKNGLFGDWVEEMDWSVGEVMEAIRGAGLGEKTLVIFVSDNGGTGYSVNRPFRGQKGSTWEGGVRVPALVWWPGKIAGGSGSGVICGMFDVMPTLVGLAGGVMEEKRKRDGKDLWPILSGEEKGEGPHGGFLYYRGLVLEAVREGKWKLHLGKGELYDLEADPGEAVNVAVGNPEVVGKLRGVAAETDGDLGRVGMGPGVRALGKVEHPRPLLRRGESVAEGE